MEGFEGEAGRISSVRLKGGRSVDCDSVLVGVGAVPNDELALGAGLPCSDGIVIDIDSRTEDASIFAIGDVAHRPVPFYGRNGRFESVPNALE